MAEWRSGGVAEWRSDPCLSFQIHFLKISAVLCLEYLEYLRTRLMVMVIWICITLKVRYIISHFAQYAGESIDFGQHVAKDAM